MKRCAGHAEVYSSSFEAVVVTYKPPTARKFLYLTQISCPYAQAMGFDVLSSSIKI